MSHEIDLIPADYRASLALARWLRRLAAAYLALLVGIGLARVAVAYEVRSRTRELERIEAAEAAAREHRELLEDLREQRAALERQLELLDGLRGGIDAKRMFLAVDRALHGKVWFVDWQFRRAGSLVEAEPEAVQTGYFVVVPAEAKNTKRKAWRVETHMEIQARAVDHSSLANFVSRLVEQPEIESVRVLNTRVRPYLTTQAVDFELAVVVKGGA